MHRFFQALLQQLPDDRRQRNGQGQGRQQHMRQKVQGQIKAQPQQAFHQVKIAHKGQLQRGCHTTRDLEHRHQHAKDQNQHQPPQKIGNRQGHTLGHIDSAFHPRFPQAGSCQRRRPTDDNRHNQGQH